MDQIFEIIGFTILPEFESEISITFRSKLLTAISTNGMYRWESDPISSTIDIDDYGKIQIMGIDQLW